MSVDKRQVLDQAQKLLEKGLIDRAIKQYLRLLEVDIDDVFVLQKVASLHVKNGSHASALEYYERAFKVLKAKEFHAKCVGAGRGFFPQIDPRTCLEPNWLHAHSPRS